MVCYIIMCIICHLKLFQCLFDSSFFIIKILAKATGNLWIEIIQGLILLTMGGISAKSYNQFWHPAEVTANIIENLFQLLLNAKPLSSM